jgi:hypothetical protein
MADKVLFLEDLLKDLNIEKRYGLKTAGLVKLDCWLRQSELPGYVRIPDFFVVPVNMDLDNPDVRSAYIKLVTPIDAPKIILARSSDPKEKPGRFQTHTSLFEPGKPDKGLEDWMKAAAKVRESGARAVIGQPMVGDLQNFVYDEDYTDSNSFFKTIPSFGGSNTAIVMNSANFIHGEYPTITACYGLGSKIARGDMDICLAENGPWRTSVVNLANNYVGSSYGYYKQQTIDLVRLSSPDAVSTIDHDPDLGIKTDWDNSLVPFNDAYLFYHKVDSDMDLMTERFGLYDLFDIVKELRKKTQKHIEIEGCVNDKGIFLFQLREYELPQKTPIALCEAEEDRMLLRRSLESLGYNRFKGDLYVSDRLIQVPKDDMFMLTNEKLVHFSDSYRKFRKYTQLIIPYFTSGGHFAAAHAFGQTVQTLYELEKVGVKAIALERISIGSMLDKCPNGRYERVDGSTVIFRDVTAECAGHEAQIFFNS